jgi:nucleoside-diphosphate-sugar epimerase
MRVAVTGANGFIGRAVCERLVDDGHDVRSIVRTPGSAPANTDEFLIDDIHATTAWPVALVGQQAVVHLAAHVHVRTTKADEALAQFRRINTEATLKLAAAAERAGVETFIFMSSIAAHGGARDSMPITLEQPSEPESPYGISKLEAEEGLRAFASSMGVTAMRIPLVHGPQAPGNFARLVSLVDRGVPLPLASVHNRRTLISQWNVADAVAHALTAAPSGFRLVQVADGAPISTPDLIRAIADGRGTRARLFAFPPSLLRWLGRITGRRDEVDRLAGSLEVQIGSSDSSFDWYPPMDADEGVRLTASRWQESTGEETRA